MSIFVELPAAEFLSLHPEVLSLLPVGLRLELVSDPDYLVRWDGKKVEFGFANDAWCIGK